MQTERTDLHTVGEKEGGTIWESSTETHTLPDGKYTASGSLLYDTGNPRLVLCDTLEGWDGRKVAVGRFKREGTYVYLWLNHTDVWQKPSQYCQAIILQLKIKQKFKKATVWDLYLILTKMKSDNAKCWFYKTQAVGGDKKGRQSLWKINRHDLVKSNTGILTAQQFHTWVICAIKECFFRQQIENR